MHACVRAYVRVGMGVRASCVYAGLSIFFITTAHRREECGETATPLGRREGRKARAPNTAEVSASEGRVPEWADLSGLNKRSGSQRRG